MPPIYIGDLFFSTPGLKILNLTQNYLNVYRVSLFYNIGFIHVVCI